MVENSTLQPRHLKQRREAFTLNIYQYKQVLIRLSHGRLAQVIEMKMLLFGCNDSMTLFVIRISLLA